MSLSVHGLQKWADKVDAVQAEMVDHLIDIKTLLLLQYGQPGSENYRQAMESMRRPPPEPKSTVYDRREWS